MTKTLCIILARAGSKGLPSKNVIDLVGRPMIEYTLDHAFAARRLDRIVVSTDDAVAAKIAHRRGAIVVGRPAELAHDTATIDDAARHALTTIEEAEHARYEQIVILYANIPVRPLDLIDASIDKLQKTGCDSVQSVYRVGKTHPLWMRQLVGEQHDELIAYQENQIYRRQDLPPVFMLNGGIIAVRRAALMNVIPGQPHAFLGTDRRAIVTDEAAVIDVDTPRDLAIARATLQSAQRGEAVTPRTFPPMHIAERAIGAGQRAYVIAELGVNHDGSVERALQLTAAAKNAGADAVKLQLFDAKLLLSSEAMLAAYQRASAHDPHEMLARLQLSVDDMLQVRAACRRMGLGFIVTCFSIELLSAMRRLDVDAVKIASPDAVNLPLIEAMLTLRKPLILSTGTCGFDELTPTLLRCAKHPLTLLHCVSAYPTPPEHANLRRIGALAATFGRPVGYSDHTDDPSTGMLAVAQGATVIEKHLTYDTAAAGPDHAASFDPDQLRDYIRRIRAAERMLAGDPYHISEPEREVRKVSRQSVCVVRDLPAGHVLTRADLTVKRPGTGIPAAQLSAVVGRPLLKAVRANALLHESDLESSQNRCDDGDITQRDVA